MPSAQFIKTFLGLGGSAKKQNELLRLKEFRLSRHFRRWEPTLLYTLLRKAYTFPQDRYKRVTQRSHFCSFELDYRVGKMLERLATVYDPMDAFGFRLDTRRSTVEHPEAGYGLFIEGTRRIGEVVAFYPGKIYPFYSLYAHDMLVNKIPKSKGRYVIVREDSTEISADPAQFAEMRNWCARNPLARGHVVNHPPLGICPNVVAVQYDFMPIHPPWLIPNSYAFQLPDRELPYIKGCMFVALRDLKDEELFMDYELAAMPFELDWYWPVPPLVNAKVLFHVNREDVNHENDPEYEYGPLPDDLERQFREAQAEWDDMREQYVRTKMVQAKRGEALKIGGYKNLILGPDNGA